MLKDRIRQRSMKVHEKSTYASRMNAKGTSFRQRIQTPEKNTAQKGEIGEDTQFILTTTKGEQTRSCTQFRAHVLLSRSED